MSSDGKAFAAIVRAFHASSAKESAMLARALRITPLRERSGELTSLLRRFGNQNFEFASMPLHELREVFHAVELGPNDLFCDAGAGYGHAVFYGASVADGRFRAIEILPARCAAMRRTSARLKLTNVEIVQGDAFAQSYADVTCVFLNNPFFPDAAARFIRHLKTKRTRALTVIAAHNIVDAFRGDPDFVEVETRADLPDYRFGVFRWKQRAGRRVTSSFSWRSSCRTRAP
jgi:protein-L-isoaspartate O-methyltransferase